MPLRYDLATLADQLARVIEASEADLRLDQAVYGLDSRSEIQLQDILAQGLATHHDIAREVCYPASAGAKKSHRMRCDIVLTPKGRPLRLDTAPPTLFDPANACEPADALWLEVKVAYQFREGGARHAAYGAQWRQAVVADLKKMEADPIIREAALLMVIFNESDDILHKDLDLFETVLVEKEVLAGFRQTRATPIWDRIGHRLCTVALWPTIQRD